MLHIAKYLLCLLYVNLKFDTATCRTIFNNVNWPTTEELSFMKRYGYLPSEQDDDLAFAYTPHSISDAVKRVQHFAGVPETGVLDIATRKLFIQRRCGIKDIEDKQQRRRRYIIQQGWNKRTITYKVINGSRTLNRDRVEVLMAQGLGMWAPHANLTFVREDQGKADIEVSFSSGAHGDGFSFDGIGRVVAHAFPPPHGAMHFDNDEIWGEDTLEDEEDVTDFFAVAVHEIGHALGMAHSPVKASVMYPYYQVPVEKLHMDDIMGLQELYLKDKLGDNSEGASESEETTESHAPRITKADSDDYRGEFEGDDDDDLPDLCNTNYDTMQTMHGLIYVFEDEWMWVMSDKKIIIDGYPKKFHDVFTELPDNVTLVKAIYENREGNIVLFSGREYWEFDRTYRLVHTGTIDKYEIPAGVDKLTTVFLSNYNNKTYLMEYERFWRYDESTSQMDPGYYKNMEAWRNIPAPVDAALVWKGDTYFFRGPRYWRFDNTLVAAHEYYPLPTAQIWFPCPVTSEMYRYTSGE